MTRIAGTLHLARTVARDRLVRAGRDLGPDAGLTTVQFTTLVSVLLMVAVVAVELLFPPFTRLFAT